MVVEENLVTAWLTLSEHFVRHAERPFRIDPATLRRDDDPPDYVAFRESAINLLLHQDYGYQHRHPCIRLFRDRMEFRNPGEAFVSTSELLEPGAKDVRNPEIVAAFRRLGLSEQAGNGIRAIFRNWQTLGHVPPVIDNDKATKTFEVRFLREALLSEAQQQFQSRLGLALQEAEARVFALACREGRVSLVDAKAVTGLMAGQAAATLEALHVQGVLRLLKENLYGLAERLEGRPDLPRHGPSASNHVDHGRSLSSGGESPSRSPDANQADMSTAHVTPRLANMSTGHEHDRAQMGAGPANSTAHGDSPSAQRGNVPTRGASPSPAPDNDHVDKATAHVTPDPSNMSTGHDDGNANPKPLAGLSPIQRQIVASCDVPRSLAELMDDLGAVNRGHFKKHHLDPLIDDGLVAMTNPAHPRARGQRYILTAAGVRLRAFHMNAEQGGEGHG